MYPDMVAVNPTKPAYSLLSDEELLGKLIGVRETLKFYRGALAPLFAPVHDQDMLPEKCSVARELVKRWLSEELKHTSVLNTPAAVRDCLRIPRKLDSQSTAKWTVGA